MFSVKAGSTLKTSEIKIVSRTPRARRSGNRGISNGYVKRLLRRLHWSRRGRNYNNASGLDSGSCHGPTHEVYTTSATEVDCAAGFFGTPAYGSDGSYTTGTCTACGAGKYRNKHNTRTTDCFEVVTGTVVVSQGSGYTEVECDEGYEGTPVYDADGEYSGGCTACADGTYKPQPGAAECEDVPPGFQGVVRGSTSHAASGATQIMECPSGTYGVTGHGPCVECETSDTQGGNVKTSEVRSEAGSTDPGIASPRNAILVTSSPETDVTRIVLTAHKVLTALAEPTRLRLHAVRQSLQTEKRQSRPWPAPKWQPIVTRPPVLQVMASTMRRQ